MTSPAPAALGVSQRWIKLGLAALLTLLLVAVMAPAYLTGQWPWITSPQLTDTDLAALNTLREEGLDIPNWLPLQHQVVTLNRQDWSVNEYTTTASGPAQQMVVLLHPQPWHSNQPQVEWVDLAGLQNWQVERRRRLRLQEGQQVLPVRADWLQVRNDDRQTLAVLQWYAWPGGGHPAPRRWFWANQRSQLTRHTLMPWVAVSLIVPMSSGDSPPVEAWMAELGAEVHRQVTAALGQG